MGAGIFRLAVPFFFTCSGFFLYEKIESHPENRKKIIGRYFERIAVLYLFWFIFNFYYVYVRRIGSTYQGTEVNRWLYLLRDLLFHNTYVGSWYLVSAIECGLISAIFKKRRSSLILLIIGLLLFVFTSLTNCYAFLLSPTLQSLANNLNNYFGGFSISFVQGLVFFALGRIIAEERAIIQKSKTWLIALIVSVLGLASLTVEVYVLGYLVNEPAFAGEDCYYSLLVLSPALLIFALSLGKSRSRSFFAIRKCSVIIYSCQGMAMLISRLIMSNYKIVSNLILLAFTLAFGIIISGIIIALDAIPKVHPFTRYIC